jgi:osmoprotectant transport system ATP-binding protein
MISFEQVCVALDGASVLRDVSLQIESGETMVLLGRSGSGKTTALKLVNRLLVPSAGHVVVEGIPTTAWDPIQLRRRVGYVMQEGGLFPHLTVEQNIGLVPRLQGWAPTDIRRRVDALLAQMELPPDRFSERYPRQLSGGQRQRVGIARALAADPPILLFDEPFGALDPVTRFELQRQFLRLRREYGKTSLFVTHDVREALRLGTRIAMLANGGVELVAPPSEFIRASSPEARTFLAGLDVTEEKNHDDVVEGTD